MNMSISYDELKKSPLGKDTATQDEIAVWFDIQNLNCAKGIKCLMNSIERNYCTKDDYYAQLNSANSSLNSVFKTLWLNMTQEQPSTIILKNMFIFMFKTYAFNKNDVEQLLKFAKRKIDSIKRKRKKIVMHSSSNAYNSSIRRLDNLFEVYAEMHDRLSNININ